MSRHSRARWLTGLRRLVLPWNEPNCFTVERQMLKRWHVPIGRKLVSPLSFVAQYYHWNYGYLVLLHGRVYQTIAFLL